MPSTNDNRGSLANAISLAVEQSLAVVGSLQAQIDSALRNMEQVAKKARKGVGQDLGALEVIDCFQHELEAARGEASDLFKRQRAVLGTVNIAMFGRTGTGKSSLIEALVHGDGATVSTGESDYTTEVRPVLWHGCQFLDTPGTNGWGRSASREQLESRARQAVEVADIVLLCFDTQSQQKGEFEKIGAWVKEYGKPVVAVLNVRNPFWRRPASVPLGSQRRRLSSTVRQHATNIETELAELGIVSAPIVAISAQRAVYARSTTPYKGPSVEQFNKLRAEFGPETLLHGSNFEVLELVFIEALTLHAPDLRLGMLNAQVRMLIERLILALENACSESKAAAEILDRAIEGLFAVVGYPVIGTKPRNALPKRQNGEDILSWVERARSGPYEVQSHGKLTRFTQQRLEAEIGTLRAQSLSIAEEAVIRAFEERRDLDAKEFSRTVFQNSQIQTVCESVMSETAEFIRRETNLVIDDARLDLEFLISTGPAITGATGNNRRKFGNFVSGGGVLSGLGGTILTFALLDPEPVSKVVLALSAFLAGIGGMVLGWIGGKLRKKAEQERQQAWAEAIASTRTYVNDLYDGFARQVSDTATAMAIEAMVQWLSDPLSRVGALWMLSSEGTSTAVALRQLKDQLPVKYYPQEALQDAATSTVASIYPNEEGATALALLGESWISDPAGLVADEGTSEPSRTRAYDPGLLQRMFEGVRAFIDRFGDTVKHGAGTHWLDEIEAVLVEDPDAATALIELREYAERGLTRLQFVGDYSSGKTSFVKRLLIDGGLPVPETLEVRADPTTDHLHTYEWEQVLLVDTPGLQSMQDAHGSVVLDAYPDASAIIYLMQPNLLVGSTAGLELILKGDRRRGLVPKLDRTIFVIHRADELGADPEAVPTEYVRLCERKKTELQQALMSRDIHVETDRIFCMSADPFHLVGDRRDVSSSQFDRFRFWDGFTEFRKTIRAINARFAGTGSDRSVLEGGLARLGRLSTSIIAKRDSLVARDQFLARLDSILSTSVAEGERLESELRMKARRMVEDHAFGNLERVAGAASDSELEETVNQLAEWWKLPTFETDVKRWQEEAQRAIEEWCQRSVDLIDRTINAPRFRATIADSGSSFDARGFSSPSQGWLGKVMNLVAHPLKGVTRDVVYWIGKAIGHNFRPWGAVKLAKLLGRVGVVLGVVSTVMDLLEIFRAKKAEKRRDELRKQLRGFVEQSATEVLASLTDGSEEADGPITYLKAVQDYFSSIVRDISSEREEIGTEIGTLEERSRTYDRCMESAWHALGSKGDEA